MIKNNTIEMVKSRFGLRKRELYSLLHIYHNYYKKGVTTNVKDIYVKLRPMIDRGYIRPLNGEIVKNMTNTYTITEKGYMVFNNIRDLDIKHPFTDREIEIINNEYINII